jgi:hypothetical protein
MFFGNADGYFRNGKTTLHRYKYEKKYGTLQTQQPPEQSATAYAAAACRSASDRAATDSFSQSVVVGVLSDEWLYFILRCEKNRKNYRLRLLYDDSIILILSKVISCIPNLR